MLQIVSWLHENWFALVQSLGIVAGLVFTGASLRQTQKAGAASDLLTLSQSHRELWSELYRRPDLARVLAPEPDFIKEPPTLAEEEFLVLVFNHFYVGWKFSHSNSIVPADVLQRDAAVFLRLPLPAAVWRRISSQMDPEFVRYMEGASRLNPAPRNA